MEAMRSERQNHETGTVAGTLKWRSDQQRTDRTKVEQQEGTTAIASSNEPSPETVVRTMNQRRSEKE